MAIAKQHDFFTTTLNMPGGLSDSATTITLSDEPTELTDTDEIYIVVDPTSSSAREIIRGVKSGLTVTTATRGAGSTSANAHIDGATVRLSPTAAHINEIADALNTPTLSGTTADTFEINTDGSSIIFDTTGLTADRTLTSPDESGEIVLIDATQTLTNKTLTTPTVTSGVFNTGVSGSAIKTVVGTPGVDTLLVTEKAVRDAIVGSVAGVSSWNGLTGAVVINNVLQNQIYS